MNKADSESEDDSKLPPIDERKPAAKKTGAAPKDTDSTEEMEELPDNNQDSSKKPPPRASLPQAGGDATVNPSPPRKRRGRTKKPDTFSIKAKLPFSKLIGKKKRPIGQVMEEEAPENETPEERRLRRNRINDRRKRARRAMKVEFLNEQFQTLKDQNDEMKEENKLLREKIAAIKRIQGLKEEELEEEATVESPSSEGSESKTSASLPRQSRLDGTIFTTLNFITAQAAARAQNIAGQQDRAEGNEEPRAARDRQGVPLDQALPRESAPAMPEAQANAPPAQASRRQQQQQDPSQQQHASVGQGASQSSQQGHGNATQSEQGMLTLDQLRAALVHTNSNSGSSQSNQTPASIDVFLSLIRHIPPQQQQSQQQSHGAPTENNLIAALLQAQGTSPSAAPQQQVQQSQNASLRLNDHPPQEHAGQVNQLAAQIIQQQLDTRAILLSLLQENQRASASTGRNEPLSPLQQEHQRRREDIGPQFLQLLQQRPNAGAGAGGTQRSPTQRQRQLEDVVRNHLLATLQPQQQQQQQEQQQQQQNGGLLAQLAALQEPSGRLVAMLQESQQQQRGTGTQSDLARLLILHVGQARGDSPAQLLSSLQQASLEDQSRRPTSTHVNPSAVSRESFVSHTTDIPEATTQAQQGAGVLSVLAALQSQIGSDTNVLALLQQQQPELQQQQPQQLQASLADLLDQRPNQILLQTALQRAGDNQGLWQTLSSLTHQNGGQNVTAREQAAPAIANSVVENPILALFQNQGQGHSQSAGSSTGLAAMMTNAASSSPTQPTRTPRSRRGLDPPGDNAQDKEKGGELQSRKDSENSS